MNLLLTSLRLTATTLLVCVAGYTLLILAFAQLFVPHAAEGSLRLRADGTVVGSELLAQAFTQPQWFWPRPSAVAYNGAGAGGSNKSPTNPELTERARQAVAAFGATADRPLPADLAAASGGGLDPHITEAAARYQIPRIAVARRMPEAKVAELVDAHTFVAGGPLGGARLVNVLELNLALDGRR